MTFPLNYLHECINKMQDFFKNKEEISNIYLNIITNYNDEKYLRCRLLKQNNNSAKRYYE